MLMLIFMLIIYLQVWNRDDDTAKVCASMENSNCGNNQLEHCLMISMETNKLILQRIEIFLVSNQQTWFPFPLSHIPNLHTSFLWICKSPCKYFFFIFGAVSVLVPFFSFITSSGFCLFILFTLLKLLFQTRISTLTSKMFYYFHF